MSEDELVFTNPRRVQVPTFELVSNPSINLKELQEMGDDCLIRNEAVIDGKLVVFSPPVRVGDVMGTFSKLVQMLEEESNERPDDGYHPAV